MTAFRVRAARELGQLRKHKERVRDEILVGPPTAQGAYPR
jgi:hypothetical protein